MPLAPTSMTSCDWLHSCDHAVITLPEVHQIFFPFDNDQCLLNSLMQSLVLDSGSHPLFEHTTFISTSFSRESCPSLFSHSRLWESFLYTVTFIIWNAICLMLATVNDSDYVIGRHCLCATPIVQHRDPLIAMTTCPSWFCADPSRRFIYITIYACLVSVSSWYTLTWLWECHIWVNHQWSLATSAFDPHYGRMLISPFVLVWYVPLSEFPLLPTSECTTLVVGIDTYQALSVHPYCFL